jgi:S1-C subfamily serine protease
MTDSKSSLSSLSQSLADAVQTAGASIVMIDARPRFPSSGVVVKPGFVLTASHTIQTDEIAVTLPDGTQLSAELLGRDPHSELALLKLSEAKGEAAKTNEQPQVGQLVLALGRAGSEGLQASLGIVSAIGGPSRNPFGGLLESYLRTDAIPYPGFSGGPLVDADGRVLGINTSGLGMSASLTIPAKLAWKIAASIEEHGGVKRGYLGVRSQFVELPEEASKTLNREQGSGLLVVAVEKDSPAAAAGVKVSDIIVGFSGQAVADHDELLVQLNSGAVGNAKQLEVLRGDKAVTLSVSVTEVQEHPRQHQHPWRHGGMRRGFGRRMWRGRR